MPSDPNSASPLNTTPLYTPAIAVTSVNSACTQRERGVNAARTSGAQLAAAGGVSAFGSLSPSR